MSMTLKEILNEVLGQSAFLQRDAFAAASDVDSIQMVSFANLVRAEILDYHHWTQLRKTETLTLTSALSYDLPDDFNWYSTESMWKAEGARNVVIPTPDYYWAWLKAGNPGTGIQYYGKLIDGKIEFASVVPGDTINFDYISKYAVRSSGGALKERFTADTDTFLLNDNTLIYGTKAFWKIEKEMPTGALDMQTFKKSLRTDVAKTSPSKTIRAGNNMTPFSPPIDSNYSW